MTEYLTSSWQQAVMEQYMLHIAIVQAVGCMMIWSMPDLNTSTTAHALSVVRVIISVAVLDNYRCDGQV